MVRYCLQAAAACVGGQLSSRDLEFFQQAHLDHSSCFDLSPGHGDVETVLCLEVLAVHMVDGEGETADERRRKEAP